MLDWLTRNKRIRELEEKIASQKRRIVVAEERYCAIAKECEKQRMLISALRDVNASLDARCNDLERSRA